MGTVTAPVAWLSTDCRPTVAESPLPGVLADGMAMPCLLCEKVTPNIMIFPLLAVALYCCPNCRSRVEGPPGGR